MEEEHSLPLRSGDDARSRMAVAHRPVAARRHQVSSVPAIGAISVNYQMNGVLTLLAFSDLRARITPCIG